MDNEDYRNNNDNEEYYNSEDYYNSEEYYNSNEYYDSDEYKIDYQDGIAVFSIPYLLDIRKNDKDFNVIPYKANYELKVIKACMEEDGQTMEDLGFFKIFHIIRLKFYRHNIFIFMLGVLFSILGFTNILPTYVLGYKHPILNELVQYLGVSLLLTGGLDYTFKYTKHWPVMIPTILVVIHFTVGLIYTLFGDVQIVRLTQLNIKFYIIFLIILALFYEPLDFLAIVGALLSRFIIVPLILLFVLTSKIAWIKEIATIVFYFIQFMLTVMEPQYVNTIAQDSSYIDIFNLL